MFMAFQRYIALIYIVYVFAFVNFLADALITSGSDFVSKVKKYFMDTLI